MLKSDDLINKVKSYNKFLNPETLDKAYNFAVKAHENQKRHSGDPYVIHPVAVANIFALLTASTTACNVEALDKLTVVTALEIVLVILISVKPVIEAEISPDSANTSTCLFSKPTNDVPTS